MIHHLNFLEIEVQLLNFKTPLHKMIFKDLILNKDLKDFAQLSPNCIISLDRQRKLVCSL